MSIMFVLQEKTPI